jgi:GNAT superfamily N-acetyltransferase
LRSCQRQTKPVTRAPRPSPSRSSPDHHRPGRHSPLTELLESAEQLGVDLEVDGELLLVVWNLSHVPIYRQNGKISGFSAGDPRDGTLFALFVDPNWEGRGIGQVLLPLACATLRQAGHKRITLGTEPGTRAERFYRRNGWAFVGNKPNGEILFRLDI